MFENLYQFLEILAIIFYTATVVSCTFVFNFTCSKYTISQILYLMLTLWLAVGQQRPSVEGGNTGDSYVDMEVVIEACQNLKKKEEEE